MNTLDQSTRLSGKELLEIETEKNLKASLKVLTEQLNSILNPDGSATIGFTMLIYDNSTVINSMRVVTNSEKAFLVPALKKYLKAKR